MWFCGYEGEKMREAFRVSSGMFDIGCWPSPEFETAWTKLTVYLRQICDRCLSLAMKKEVQAPLDLADDKSVSYAVHYPNNRYV
jgi:hypothetical protein